MPFAPNLLILFAEMFLISVRAITKTRRILKNGLSIFNVA